MMYSKCHTEKPKPIIGYTTRRHLLLDLDNTTLTKASSLTRLIQQQYPKVGDCLICQSSTRPLKQGILYTKLGRPLIIRTLPSYHLIFNNNIGYNSCCYIIHILANLHLLERDYVRIRRFRGDMTLRISPSITTEGVKPIPQPKTWIKNPWSLRQDDMILNYLKILYYAVTLFPQHQPLFSEQSLYPKPHQQSQR